MTLTDEYIEDTDVDGLVICFTQHNIINTDPNVIVKTYDNFYPLACYKLNNKTIGDYFNIHDMLHYMVL